MTAHVLANTAYANKLCVEGVDNYVKWTFDRGVWFVPANDRWLMLNEDARVLMQADDSIDRNTAAYGIPVLLGDGITAWTAYDDIESRTNPPYLMEDARERDVFGPWGSDEDDNLDDGPGHDESTMMGCDLFDDWT